MKKGRQRVVYNLEEMLYLIENEKEEAVLLVHDMTEEGLEVVKLKTMCSQRTIPSPSRIPSYFE
jgi:ribosomal protein L7Ae-like RNA K-turn-binding protein